MRLVMPTLPRRSRPPRRRLQDNGEAEVRAVQDEISNLDAQDAQLNLEIREKEDDIKGLQVRWRGAGCWVAGGLEACNGA